jgi:HPt (histidine-containing phosphotransfer) domain-containing protein
VYLYNYLQYGFRMKKSYSFENLNQLADGDASFITSIVEAFLEEIPEDLESMMNAVHNENKELVYYYAHKMKPNLKMFGLELEDTIKSMESWSKSDEGMDVVIPLIKHISDVLEKTFKELRNDFNL